MLKINDTQETQELDRDAMTTIEGAFYRSAKSSYSNLQSVYPGLLYKKTEFYQDYLESVEGTKGSN